MLATLPSSSCDIVPLLEVSATIIRKPRTALLTCDALAPHLLRQALLDAAQAVLHLGLRDIEIGAGLEGER